MALAMSLQREEGFSITHCPSFVPRQANTVPALYSMGGSPDNLQELGAVLDLVRYVTQFLFQGCGDRQVNK